MSGTTKSTGISLEMDPHSRQERLVGLDGEVMPDERIIEAVAGCLRLFSYVVGELAMNQIRKDNPDFTLHPGEPKPKEMLEIMGVIRDVLIEGVDKRRCSSP